MKKISLSILLSLFCLNVFSQWNSVANFSSNNLTSVYFTSSTTGYAVSFGGEIFKSTDGGTNWTLQTTASGPLNSIFCLDSLKCWAAGNNGIIYNTLDGGTTWTPQTSGTSQALSAVFFVDTLHGCTVGSAGVLFTTSDGGNNWNSIPSPTTFNLHAVYFADINHGWAVGDSVTLVITSYSVIPQNNVHFLRSVYFTDTLVGYTSSLAGTIQKTTDGGVSWNDLTSGTPNDLNSIRFTDNNNGFAVGANGTILNTTDAGVTWNTQASGTLNTLYGVHFPNLLNGFIVGQSGTALKTNNAGVCATPNIVVSGIPTICQGASASLAANGANTYTWSTGATTTNINLSPSTTTGYTLSGTDALGCTGSTTFTIIVTPGDSISGVVKDTLNNPVTQGLVYLFHKQISNPGVGDTASITSLNANGSYVFPAVPYGDYFIMVNADTTNPLYHTAIPTYYGISSMSYQWDSATVINHYTCGGGNSAGHDIQLLQLPGNLTGPGQITGQITAGPGYGVRLNHGHNAPFGAPLKGVDIKLGKNPGGSPAARTTTDNNGNYQFNNIPVGNYRIYVNIPNYGMDSVLAISITPSNTVSANNNYYVDSTMVRVDTCGIPTVTYTMVANTTPSVWDVFPTYSLTTNAIWYWGDGTSTAGMYPSHTYSTPGWYNICVTAFAVCNDSASYCQNDTLYRSSHNATNSVIQVNVVNGNIGVTDHQHSAANFEVYPNPAKTNITLKSQNELGLVIISNSLGQVVYKENIQATQKQLDISTLPAGVYVVNLHGRHSRIVKE